MKIVCGLLIVVLGLGVTAILRADALKNPTPTPGVVADDVVKISFVVNVNRNADISIEKQFNGLSAGMVFVYNKNKTRVLVIMDVAAENAWKVRDVVRRNGWGIKTREDGKLEREFRVV